MYMNASEATEKASCQYIRAFTKFKEKINSIFLVGHWPVTTQPNDMNVIAMFPIPSHIITDDLVHQVEEMTKKNVDYKTLPRLVVAKYWASLVKCWPQRS